MRFPPQASRCVRLSALGTVALLVALHAPLSALAAQLVQLSADPFTNPTSAHATQVEPDTFSYGTTIVAAFQSGRFFNGGSSDIGWATSSDGGASWTHGFLPGTTVYASPAGLAAAGGTLSAVDDQPVPSPSSERPTAPAPLTAN